MRKRAFGHMRTAKAQISLRIRAVWSGPSLSANRIIGHYRMYQLRANARMRLCACVGWIWICAFCACSKIHFLLGAAHLLGTHFLNYIVINARHSIIYKCWDRVKQKKCLKGLKALEKKPAKIQISLCTDAVRSGFAVRSIYAKNTAGENYKLAEMNLHVSLRRHSDSSRLPLFAVVITSISCYATKVIILRRPSFE